MMTVLAIATLFIGAIIGTLVSGLLASRRLAEQDWRLYRLHRRAERYRALAAPRGEKIDRLCDEIERLTNAGREVA